MPATHLPSLVRHLYWKLMSVANRVHRAFVNWGVMAVFNGVAPGFMLDVLTDGVYRITEFDPYNLLVKKLKL